MRWLITVGTLLFFLSCAIPVDLAVIRGEWKGDNVYFSLDSYAEEEDVLYGCNISTYYIGELAGSEGCEQVFGTCYKYVVRTYPDLPDEVLSYSESYYFNLNCFNSIEGYATIVSERIGENGEIELSDFSWLFNANRTGR